MILDVSPRGRSRMRREAREDLAQWCEREEITPDTMTVEILGRHGLDGYETRMSFDGNRRRKRGFVKDYPPRSCWWYMAEGGKS